MFIMHNFLTWDHIIKDEGDFLKIHIVFSSDEKYVPHMGVAMISILSNASENEVICFHVISDSISPESRQKVLSLGNRNKCEIEIFDMDEHFRKKLGPVNRIHPHQHVTASAYSRLLIGSIFPDLDKVLYLDCDLIVLGGLGDLWEMNMADHTIAVVEEPRDPEPLLRIPHYFNSGVMMINLNRWRVLGYERRCLKIEEWVLKNRKYHDQSILNHVFRSGDVACLRKNYNYMVKFGKYLEEPVERENLPIIVHYASGQKPWILDFFDEKEMPFSQYYRKYRAMSPWSKGTPKKSVNLKEVLRYMIRHPKDLPYVLKRLHEWRKSFY